MLLVSLRFRITSSPFWALPVRIWSFTSVSVRLISPHCSSDSGHVFSLLFRLNSFRINASTIHCMSARFCAGSVQFHSSQRIAGSRLFLSTRFQFGSTPFVALQLRLKACPIASRPFHFTSIPRRFAAIPVDAVPRRLGSIRFYSPPTPVNAFLFRLRSALFDSGSDPFFALPFLSSSFLRASSPTRIHSVPSKAVSPRAGSFLRRFISFQLISTPAYVESKRFSAAAVRFRSALIKSAQR